QQEADLVLDNCTAMTVKKSSAEHGRFVLTASRNLQTVPIYSTGQFRFTYPQFPTSTAATSKVSGETLSRSAASYSEDYSTLSVAGYEIVTQLSSVACLVWPTLPNGSLPAKPHCHGRLGLS